MRRSLEKPSSAIPRSNHVGQGASLYELGLDGRSRSLPSRLSSTGAGPRGWGRCRRLAVAQCTPATCTAGRCRCARPPARRAACGSRSSSPRVVHGRPPSPVTPSPAKCGHFRARRHERRIVSRCLAQGRGGRVLTYSSSGRDAWKPSRRDPCRVALRSRAGGAPLCLQWAPSHTVSPDRSAQLRNARCSPMKSG
jgi:hypothetical protein